MADLTLDILKTLGNEARAELRKANTAQAREKWRIDYLGRKGKLPQLLRQVKELPPKERKEIGRVGNELRKKLEQLYREHTAGPAAPALLRSEELRTGKAPRLPHEAPEGEVGSRHPQRAAVGHLHPLTLSLRLAQEIFAALGFQFVEGPHIEESVYNFDYLNIDSEHPARAETDTFYLKDWPNLVLRTHVSPLQIRGPREHTLKPPFRIFYYGPTFRSEKEDATHGSVFHQYEFMVVDETVNLADLKSIVQTFYSLFFGREMEIRFRPGYFPFVEPGLEVDMRDKVTKKGNWLEMAGAGMVHPTVLKNINVDPEKYQGIALGGGLDRLTMLKYGIPDIRLLYSGNTRFLTQF